MKTFYECDVCGKRFDTEEKAIACEKAHAEKAEKERILAKEKEDMAKEVNKLIKAYLEKFNEFPTIEISGSVVRRLPNWFWL